MSPLASDQLRNHCSKLETCKQCVEQHQYVFSLAWFLTRLHNTVHPKYTVQGCVNIHAGCVRAWEWTGSFDDCLDQRRHQGHRSIGSRQTGTCHVKPRPFRGYLLLGRRQGLRGVWMRCTIFRQTKPLLDATCSSRITISPCIQTCCNPVIF